MAIEFRLPDLGENIESGDVVNVLVREGDVISANQAVVEVETDKAVVEVPCPHAGRIVSLHVKKGDTIPVGGPILSLETTLTADSGPSLATPRPTPAPAAAAPPPSPTPVAATPPAAAPPPPPPEPVAPPAAAPAVAARPTPPAAELAPMPAAPAAQAPTSAAPSAASDAVAAGPAIRRLARELGIELANVIGTGEGGRITREDVIAAVRQVTRVVSAPSTPGVPVPAKPTPPPPGVTDQDPWGGIRHEKLTKIRKTIAANMVRSTTTIPHVTNFDDADITELERIRKGSAADYAESNVKLTMMVFVMKAVAHALKLHPVLNAALNMEHDEVIYKEYVNLGIAVDTERGLVVPVVRNVDRLTLPQIAYALAEVTKKARASQFTLEDLRGGTFTISNLGAVGGAYSTPIINHPEVAVLLVGRSRKLPVATDDNKIEIRLMMPLSLSYDHRLVDGAAAARFLNEVIDFLQAPGRLLLAP